MRDYFLTFRRSFYIFLSCLMAITVFPIFAMAEEFSESSATETQYTGSDCFEMPVIGATGFAPRDLPVMLTDGSKGVLKAGTSFTIIADDGANWKFKTSEKNGHFEGTVASSKCMINLPDVLPSVEYKIANAESSLYKVGSTKCGSGKVINLDGVTGENLYGDIKLYNPRLGRDEYLVPIMYATAQKWANVQKAAQADGDCLIIYDAYRPAAVQAKVRAAVSKISNDRLIKSGYWHKGWFISQSISDHQRGIAADVSLVSCDSSMPSDMHDLSVNGVIAKNPNYFNKKDFSNTALLVDTFANNEGAMRLAHYGHAAGLESLASEWWHFTDSAAKSMARGNKGGFYVSECLSARPEDVVL